MNPNEAPKGYKAKEFYPNTEGLGCARCAFDKLPKNCSEAKCAYDVRSDQTSVYFVNILNNAVKLNQDVSAMYDMLSPVQKRVMDVLLGIPSEIYLTGSQKWRTADSESDFDFFTENGEKIRVWLEENGFSKIQGRMYADSECLCVYRKETSANIPQIDIQLVKDVGKKRAAQELLLFFFPSGLTRNRRRALWEKAYELV
jgi:hypothetical protein